MEMPDFLFIQLTKYDEKILMRRFDTKSSFDGATVYVNYDEYQRVYEELKQENEENCRLLGKSAERELALLAEIDRLKFELKCADVDFSYWKEKAESFECEITDLKDKLEEKLNRLLPDDLCPLDDKSWQQSDAFGRIEYLVAAHKSNRDELKMVWGWVVELKDKLAKTEWRPIETAPKDGTPILACYGNHYVTNGFLPVAVKWGTYHPNAKGNECFRDCRGHKIETITHWMPLPEPPTTEVPKCLT